MLQKFHTYKHFCQLFSLCVVLGCTNRQEICIVHSFYPLSKFGLYRKWWQSDALWVGWASSFKVQATKPDIANCSRADLGAPNDRTFISHGKVISTVHLPWKYFWKNPVSCVVLLKWQTFLLLLPLLKWDKNTNVITWWHHFHWNWLWAIKFRGFTAKIFFFFCLSPSASIMDCLIPLFTSGFVQKSSQIRLILNQMLAQSTMSTI